MITVNYAKLKGFTIKTNAMSYSGSAVVLKCIIIKYCARNQIQLQRITEKESRDMTFPCFSQSEDRYRGIY